MRARKKPSKPPGCRSSALDEKQLLAVAQDTMPFSTYCVAMSAENVETVRWCYQRWNEGELGAMLTRLAADFEYVPSGVVPGLRAVYRGHDGWLDFWRDFRETFESLRIELDDTRDLDREVVALLTFTAHGRDGLEASRRFANVWTFSDGGLVRRIEAFGEWSKALEAVGLPGSTAA